jgi:branched-chain amino acid transport system ATP-binding protein
MKSETTRRYSRPTLGGNPVQDNLLLDVRGIVSRYGKKEILHGVSLQIKRGDIVSLIGPNGAGKSTVFLTILGYLKLDAGQVYFKDRDISRMETNKIIEMGVGSCPQGRAIFPDMTVSEHLDMGAWTVKSPNQRKEARERVYDLFPILKEREKQKAKTMSGGERQMLTFGMAMMINPELLLLDEPSLGLAPKILDSVFENILNINKQGISIFVVEQNAAKVLEISHRGYVLDMGRNRYEGKSQDLLRNEKVRQLYLGGRSVGSA